MNVKPLLPFDLWRSRFFAALSSALLLLSSVNAVAEVPYVMSRSSLFDDVGVNMHYVYVDEEELDLVREAGFKVVRFDFSWELTEPKRGRYDFSMYDRLVRRLEKRGIRPLFILAYSNRLYAPEIEVGPEGKKVKRVAAPTTPEAVDAYVKWATAAVRRYAKYDVVWELWNEPDAWPTWAPKEDVGAYVRLANAACSAMRVDVPAVHIIGPAVTALSVPTAKKPLPPFFRDVAASPVMNCLSGFSVHLYELQQPPEQALPRYELMRRHFADFGLDTAFPIVSGEWGYTTKGKKTEAISKKLQAAYVVRMILLNRAAKIPLSIMYSWRDSGNDPEEKEQGFGIMHRDLRPKPSYLAIKALHEGAGRFDVVNVLTGLPSGLGGVECRTEAGERFDAIWSVSQRPVKVSRKELGQYVSVRDIRWRLVHDREILIGPEPVYVTR